MKRSSCFLCALILVATPARAESPPVGKSAQELVDPWGTKKGREVAQAKGAQALDLFEKGSWQGAYALFAEAEQIVHAPTLLIYMARCKDKLGELVAARALYERAMSEPLPKGAPAAWIRGYKEAEAELAALKARIPTLSLSITGVPAAGATIRIDGVAAGATSVWLDPGEHTIEITAPGAVPATRKVVLEPGRPMALSIPMQPVMTPAPASSAPRPLSIAGFTVAGVAAGAGTALAILSTIKGSDADAKLQQIEPSGKPSTACAGANPSSECRALHDARVSHDTFANAAIWTLIGAAAVAGGTLVYTVVVPPVQGVRTVRIIPAMTLNGGALLLQGSF